MNLIYAVIHGPCRGKRVDPTTLGQQVQIYCPVCRKLHMLTLDEIIRRTEGSDEDVKADRDAKGDA